MPRAPDGTQAHTAGHRSSDASHWRLCEAPIRVRAVFHGISADPDRHPRRASRRSTCVPHGGTPSLHDPCWTSMSKRSVQDASEPVSAEKTAALDRPRRDRSRAFRIGIDETRFANDQNKTPPEWNPRAFAFLGDRGDRSPEKRISLGCGNLSRRAVVRRRTAARTMPHRAGGARVRMGWRCGWRVSWLESLDSCRETDAEDCDGRARYTRRFANANIFFTNANAADERPHGMRHGSLRILHGMHSCRTKKGRLDRRPVRNAMAALDYGISTLSTTWITPLL